MEQFVTVSAMVLALTQYFKGYIPQKHKWWAVPTLACVLGVGLNVYTQEYSPEVVMEGLGYAFIAAGLYEFMPKK